jgi:hypothetical protein
MTTKNVYVERLEQLEKDVKRIKLQYKRLQEDNAILRPLAEWAASEILKQQREFLELDKRLGLQAKPVARHA